MGNIEEDLHAIKNKLQSWEILVPLVAIIKEALVGNEIAKDGGLVARMQRNELKIEELCERLEIVEQQENKKELYVKIIWSMGAFIIGIILTLIARHFLIKM